MEPLQINSGEDFVKVNISNSKNNGIALDLKFAKSLSVGQLKCKLEIITGGNAATMQLELYNGERLVTKLHDDATLLGALPIETGMRIHVIDNFNWITDVEKFELTNEQYETKPDTVRNFLKKNRMGKYNEEEARQQEEKLQRQKQLDQERADLCTIGARCQVTVPGNPLRRGTIRYKGPIDGKKGIFIGVEYDEPLGKNNGSIEGKSYFSCAPNYGGFVLPNAVEVGDFPPEDAGLDDDEI
ncbi:PREDICTED: tubulin-folding cofactor B [Rhagoletis zephyria]|uniref:tubulin-folding cofactor B n=1 Tax=Rhagoletis zephyria TaxID=28612 RepID=UPI00081182EE|nr:PREDICTED: tubulin-folding cofactor B [Rhagoletis zephyria]